jgi:signal transduction histidine kinase
MPMFSQKLDPIIYKYRTALSVGLLAVIIYFVLYTWLVLPPLTLVTGWYQDIELRVLPRIVEADYSRYVEPDDLILAIDGRPVKRGEPIFAAPVKEAYELTIQRGDEVFTQTVIVEERRFFNVWVLSHAVLALAIWLLGYLTAQFARPGQTAAVYAGLGFQLIAAGIVSPGPFQLGAPGGWIVGHTLILYFPLIILYLAFAPGVREIGPRGRGFLHGVFYFLTLMALGTVIESFFLFPHTSWGHLVGVRSFTVITILAGIGVVSGAAILLMRVIRAPQDSYERQQLRILAVFLALAILPMFVFVILPLGIFMFIPFPFVYSLFLLAPAGYFFVLHRQGFLQLDALFGRIITVLTLVLAISVAYGTGVYMLEVIFDFDFGSAEYGGFALLLVVMAVSTQKHVQSGVDILLYGRESLDEEDLQEARLKLSANPEPETAAELLSQLLSHFQARQGAVLVKSENQFQLLVGDNVASFAIERELTRPETLLRTKKGAQLEGFPDWVELATPIQGHGDLLGVLLLSRPVNGYFNARQVETAQVFANILAPSLLVITLVEALQELSRRMLYAKQLQRQEIATEIHNEPLRLLSKLLMELQTGDYGAAMRRVNGRIIEVSQELRRIMAGLRPPILKDSVEWIARQTAREFAEINDELEVTLHPIDIRSEKPAAEYTKIVFYNVLTEALSNISKHARATRVQIGVHYGEERLILEVEDNGKGADLCNWSLTDLVRARHMGLADMRRWASIGGGELRIETATGQGMRIHLHLPTDSVEAETAWQTGSWLGW